MKAITSFIKEETNPTNNMIGAFTKKINNACCQLSASVPLIAGKTNELRIVSVGEMIIKKMNEIIKVAKSLYLILFVYVSLGTWNKAVNHLPIAVNGMKFEIINERIRAITKLVNIFIQSIVAKEIVKTPDSKSD